MAACGCRHADPVIVCVCACVRDFGHSRCAVLSWEMVYAMAEGRVQRELPIW